LPKEVIEEYSRTLGNPWNLINPGFMFKAYPCAHISHFGVTAGLQLRKEHAIDWKQIDEIEFRIPPLIQKLVHYDNPGTGIEGKFSPGYCLCRALIEGKIKIEHFTDANVKDPTTLQLMQKIRWVVIDQDLKDGPFGYQEVVLNMRDKRVYSCKVAHAKGEPQNPQTPQEFTAKYLDCARYAQYTESTAARIQEMIMNLEKVGDIAQLAAIIG
jgi:2-methylcitrate dehydratase PrpD